jgi:hypothetical protein
MPLGITPADIADEHLRETMERASQALDEGQTRECVEACAEAYLSLLRDRPQVREALETVLSQPGIREGVERGMIRTAPLMWPRFAAKLDLSGDEPTIELDRNPAFGETIQYYEFTLDVIHQAEVGELQTGMAGGQ